MAQVAFFSLLSGYIMAAMFFSDLHKLDLRKLVAAQFLMGVGFLGFIYLIIKNFTDTVLRLYGGA